MIQLPAQRLAIKARQWNVIIDHVGETHSSLLGFGERDGIGVVLKIIKREGDEWHSGEVLSAYSGDGCVRVYDFEPGAILLERLDPGESLVERVRRGAERSANDILTEVIRKLAGHTPPSRCVPVMSWALSFDRYVKSGANQIRTTVVEKSRAIFHELAASQGAQMLLHGDLHHYNVLLDSGRGWLAIDPKGIVGELEYEIGAILRNPMEREDLFLSQDLIDGRARVLSRALNLDYDRILQWAYAQAVLSAIWGIEDGVAVAGDDAMLKLAGVIEAMLR